VTPLVVPPVAPLPGDLAGPPRLVGRLGPALRWLAEVQGHWPPRLPGAVRPVVVTDGDTTTGLEAGLEQGDALADAGADLLLAGHEGGPVPGLVVLAALLGLEPVHAIGTAATDDWAQLTSGVRDGLRAARLHVGEPERLLHVTGSAGPARRAGVLAQSAVRRTPVLLDGAPVTVAAALVAERLAPGAAAWWYAGQRPVRPAAQQALRELGLDGLLDLGVEGRLGAELAWRVLEHTLGVLAEEPPDG
jgi:nicotinate-nucleotide--dimethylbenzimidazole phosphoribosyltransferase